LYVDRADRAAEYTTKVEVGHVRGAQALLSEKAHKETARATFQVLRWLPMARHLRPESRYLVQLELRDPTDPWRGVRPSIWEREQDGVRARTNWQLEEIDLAAGIELQRGTIECLSGPDQGQVFEEVHRMAAWTPDRWADAISETPFRYVAVYDGDQDHRPERPIGTSGRLLSHELVL
jgi:hypothetical protein